MVLDLGALASVSYQTTAVRAIATRHPNLIIVVAHLGQPGPSVEANPDLWRVWFDQLDLGRLANVFFDNSKLPAKISDETYPYPRAARHLRLAVERIRPTRIMWGTNQSGLLNLLNYPQLVEQTHQHKDFLTSREQAMTLGKNALRVYGRERKA